MHIFGHPNKLLDKEGSKFLGSNAGVLNTQRRILICWFRIKP